MKSTLFAKLIVVEALLKPQKSADSKGDSILVKMADSKDKSQEERNGSSDAETSEPGIEFLKGAASEGTSMSEPQLIPLIHNLPGASTIYNSYRTAMQGWKNSAPKLVQYSASDLEVVVYRKNGQVDTLSGRASDDSKKLASINTTTESCDSGGTTVENPLPGFSRAKIETRSSTPPSAPSTPPRLQSPIPAYERRFPFNQGFNESCKINGRESSGDVEMKKSKLIPDLEGLVPELLKPPESGPLFPSNQTVPPPVKTLHKVQKDVDTQAENSQNMLKKATTYPDPLQDSVSFLPAKKNCQFMVFGSGLPVCEMKSQKVVKKMEDGLNLNSKDAVKSVKLETCDKGTSPDEPPLQVIVALTKLTQTDLETATASTQSPVLVTQTKLIQTDLDTTTASTQTPGIVTRTKPTQTIFKTATVSTQSEIIGKTKQDVTTATESTQTSQEEPESILKTDTCCQVGMDLTRASDAEVKCKPDYTSKEIQTPAFCCQEREEKLNKKHLDEIDHLIYLADGGLQEILSTTEFDSILKDNENGAAKPLVKQKGDELLSDDHIFARINRYYESRMSTHGSLLKLEKEVENLKIVAAAQPKSFSEHARFGEDSVEYFEDELLPSKGQEQEGAHGYTPQLQLPK